MLHLSKHRKIFAKLPTSLDTTPSFDRMRAVMIKKKRGEFFKLAFSTPLNMPLRADHSH
jgi:hypothetical protein